MTAVSGSRTGRALGAILVLGFVLGTAEASGLRIAAWNLEHLNDRPGEGCVERTEEDFDTIARRVEALGADVVAFQEVENAAAARRVFNPAKWNIVMSSRPDTGEGPTCYNRPEGRLQHQGTGIAVRRSVAYRRGTDLSSLAGGNPFLRWGTHIVVGRGERRLHVLSVHLKSGCWGADQDEQGREPCTVLRSQMSALRAWIDERLREGERFVIAGDFNRRLAIPGDWAWGLLSPAGRPLELATEGLNSRCDSRFPNFIDHLVLGGPEGPIARPGSFREEPRDAPHPDHCAISVAIADGPPGAAGTRAALKAWNAAFARTSTDHLVGSIERRLAARPGSYATLGGIAFVDGPGAPDVSRLLDRASFRFSPPGETGGARWSSWGAGAVGSMSAREHDLEGRVRTATLGADVERGRATLGIALSRSLGRGSTLATGPIDAELSSVAPYAAMSPREGMDLWAVVGKGDGTLRYEPAAGKLVRTDLETTLGGLGLRAKLGEMHGMQWSTHARAALTRIKSGTIADLPPIESRAGRLRAGIEGSRHFELRGGAALAPSMALGIRSDAGDDSQGTALELGAGLHYASADGRLRAEGHARGYLARNDGNGWELGGQLALGTDARGRGLSLTLAPTWRAGSGDDRMVSSDPWFAADGGRRAADVVFELGYGVATGAGHGLARPYFGVEWASDAESTVQLGARWRWGEACGFSLEVEHDEGESTNDDYALIAGAEFRW